MRLRALIWFNKLGSLQREGCKRAAEATGVGR